MPVVQRRLLAAVLLALALSCALALAQSAPARPAVVVAELDGIIHPISAEYLGEAIDLADSTGAALVVFVLRTPGGLLDSTRTIVSRMITSRAPVVVYVAPSGARAASAGFVITIAADVAAMAPGTHIGAAHPVSSSGEAQDTTTSEKAASDAAAYVRTLAAARKRNVALAEEAVLKSRAFTDSEASGASPPLVDMVAPDLNALLRTLDGKTITRFDGRTIVLRLQDAEIVRTEMSWRQKLLGAIAHPQVAYLLLTLGILGLTVELWNPGSVLPGVAGGLSLLLAFFAFQIVPVNTAGLLLVIFGVALLILEVKVPSFGALGIGGTLSLLLGSIMMTREVPGVSVSLRLIVPVVLAVAGVVLFLGRLSFRALQLRPVTGREALVGAIGRTRTAVSATEPGQIDVHGEIWRAISDAPIAAHVSVRVVSMQGLTLRVAPAPAGPSTPQGEATWKA
jgi:membrane-bound serine protease (ClpP class)